MESGQANSLGERAVNLHRNLNQKQYIFAPKIAPATSVNLPVSAALRHFK